MTNREKMENYKRILLPFSVFIIIIIIIIFIGGYLFINQQTKKELGELKTKVKIEKQEARKVKETFPPPLASSRRILPPNRSKMKKKATLFLKTEKNSYSLGENFNLLVKIKAKGYVVDGVEFILNYNPQQIKISQPILGNFFSLYPQKSVDKQKGQVRVIALQKASENKPLNEEIVVTLPVVSLQKGTVNFSFNKEKTHIAGYGGQDLLKEAIPLIIKIE